MLSLANVDQALNEARLRCVAIEERETLRNLLLDAHHQLMSVPPFEDLPDEGDGPRVQAGVYEVCRLTVILYSCAVVFPLPTMSGWHLKLCRKIRKLNQMVDILHWSPATRPLAVWSLFVASMAGFHYEKKLYFKDTLRVILNQMGLTAWPRIRNVLQEFLWSSLACEQGGQIVWHRIRTVDSG
jgi:hypothetical protein